MSDLRIHLAAEIFAVEENLAGKYTPSGAGLLADRDMELSLQTPVVQGRDHGVGYYACSDDLCR